MKSTCLRLLSGDGSAGAVHSALHQCQPESAGSREGAEVESEDWTNSGSSAPKDLQRLCSGGSAGIHPILITQKEKKDNSFIYFVFNMQRQCICIILNTV